MTIRKSELFLVLLSFLSIVFAMYIYPFMPEVMASHWNLSGEVDGYMSAFWGTFLFPMLVIFMSVLFIAIPRIDPEKKNIDSFRKDYDRLVMSIIFFLIVVFFFVVLWNIGIELSINIVLSLAMAMLFFNIGSVMGRAKKNWFVGIRTPWTLSNEKVWNSTHRLGERVFKISSVILLLGIFSTKFFLYATLVVILGSLYLVLYSYLEYRKYGK